MKADATALRERCAFNTGYVIALCNLQNLHGSSECAHDVLSELGVTRREIAEMDLSDYDKAALRKIERGRAESPYVDGRRRRALLAQQESANG